MESSSGKKCCCVYAGKRSDQSRIMERIRSCIHKRISAQFDRQGPRCLSLCSVNIASMCTRISNFSIRHCTCEPHLQVKEMRMRIIIGEQKKPERTVRQTMDTGTSLFILLPNVSIKIGPWKNKTWNQRPE